MLLIIILLYLNQLMSVIYFIKYLVLLAVIILAALFFSIVITLIVLKKKYNADFEINDYFSIKYFKINLSINKDTKISINIQNICLKVVFNLFNICFLVDNLLIELENIVNIDESVINLKEFNVGKFNKDNIIYFDNIHNINYNKPLKSFINNKINYKEFLNLLNTNNKTKCNLDFDKSNSIITYNNYIISVLFRLLIVTLKNVSLKIVNKINIESKNYKDNCTNTHKVFTANKIFINLKDINYNKHNKFELAVKSISVEDISYDKDDITKNTYCTIYNKMLTIDCLNISFNNLNSYYITNFLKITVDSIDINYENKIFNKYLNFYFSMLEANLKRYKENIVMTNDLYKKFLLSELKLSLINNLNVYINKISINNISNKSEYLYSIIIYSISINKKEKDISKSSCSNDELFINYKLKNSKISIYLDLIEILHSENYKSNINYDNKNKNYSLMKLNNLKTDIIKEAYFKDKGIINQIEENEEIKIIGEVEYLNMPIKSDNIFVFDKNIGIITTNNLIYTINDLILILQKHKFFKKPVSLSTFTNVNVNIPIKVININHSNYNLINYNKNNSTNISTYNSNLNVNCIFNNQSKVDNIKVLLKFDNKINISSTNKINKNYTNNLNYNCSSNIFANINSYIDIDIIEITIKENLLSEKKEAIYNIDINNIEANIYDNHLNDFIMILSKIIEFYLVKSCKSHIIKSILDIPKTVLLPREFSPYLDENIKIDINRIDICLILDYNIKYKLSLDKFCFYFDKFITFKDLLLQNLTKNKEFYNYKDNNKATYLCDQYFKDLVYIDKFEFIFKDISTCKTNKKRNDLINKIIFNYIVYYCSNHEDNLSITHFFNYLIFLIKIIFYNFEDKHMIYYNNILNIINVKYSETDNNWINNKLKLTSIKVNCAEVKHNSIVFFTYNKIGSEKDAANTTRLNIINKRTLACLNNITVDIYDNIELHYNESDVKTFYYIIEDLKYLAYNYYNNKLFKRVKNFRYIAVNRQDKLSIHFNSLDNKLFLGFNDINYHPNNEIFDFSIQSIKFEFVNKEFYYIPDDTNNLRSNTSLYNFKSKSICNTNDLNNKYLNNLIENNNDLKLLNLYKYGKYNIHSDCYYKYNNYFKTKNIINDVEVCVSKIEGNTSIYNILNIKSFIDNQLMFYLEKYKDVHNNIYIYNKYLKEINFKGKFNSIFITLKDDLSVSCKKRFNYVLSIKLDSCFYYFKKNTNYDINNYDISEEILLRNTVVGNNITTENKFVNQTFSKLNCFNIPIIEINIINRTNVSILIPNTNLNASTINKNSKFKNSNNFEYDNNNNNNNNKFSDLHKYAYNSLSSLIYLNIDYLDSLLQLTIIFKYYINLNNKNQKSSFNKSAASNTKNLQNDKHINNISKITSKNITKTNLYSIKSNSNNINKYSGNFNKSNRLNNDKFNIYKNFKLDLLIFDLKIIYDFDKTFKEKNCKLLSNHNIEEIIPSTNSNIETNTDLQEKNDKNNLNINLYNSDNIESIKYYNSFIFRFYQIGTKYNRKLKTNDFIVNLFTVSKTNSSTLLDYLYFDINKDILFLNENNYKLLLEFNKFFDILDIKNNHKSILNLIPYKNERELYVKSTNYLKTSEFKSNKLSTDLTFMKIFSLIATNNKNSIFLSKSLSVNRTKSLKDALQIQNSKNLLVYIEGLKLIWNKSTKDAIENIIMGEIILIRRKIEETKSIFDDITDKRHKKDNIYRTKNNNSSKIKKIKTKNYFNNRTKEFTSNSTLIDQTTINVNSDDIIESNERVNNNFNLKLEILDPQIIFQNEIKMCCLLLRVNVVKVYLNIVNNVKKNIYSKNSVYLDLVLLNSLVYSCPSVFSEVYFIGNSKNNDNYLEEKYFTNILNTPIMKIFIEHNINILLQSNINKSAAAIDNKTSATTKIGIDVEEINSNIEGYHFYSIMNILEIILFDRGYSYSEEIISIQAARKELKEKGTDYISEAIKSKSNKDVKEKNKILKEIIFSISHVRLNLLKKNQGIKLLTIEMVDFHGGQLIFKDRSSDIKINVKDFKLLNEDDKVILHRNMTKFFDDMEDKLNIITFRQKDKFLSLFSDSEANWKVIDIVEISLLPIKLNITKIQIEFLINFFFYDNLYNVNEVENNNLLNKSLKNNIHDINSINNTIMNRVNIKKLSNKYNPNLELSKSVIMLDNKANHENSLIDIKSSIIKKNSNTNFKTLPVFYNKFRINDLDLHLSFVYAPNSKLNIHNLGLLVSSFEKKDKFYAPSEMINKFSSFVTTQILSNLPKLLANYFFGKESSKQDNNQKELKQMLLGKKANK